MIHKVHIDIYTVNYRLGTQLFSHRVDTRIVTEESIECKTIKSKLYYFSFYLVFFIRIFCLFFSGGSFACGLSVVLVVVFGFWPLNADFVFYFI